MLLNQLIVLALRLCLHSLNYDWDYQLHTTWSYQQISQIRYNNAIYTELISPTRYKLFSECKRSIFVTLDQCQQPNFRVDRSRFSHTCGQFRETRGSSLDLNMRSKAAEDDQKHFFRIQIINQQMFLMSEPIELLLSLTWYVFIFFIFLWQKTELKDVSRKNNSMELRCGFHWTIYFFTLLFLLLLAFDLNYISSISSNMRTLICRTHWVIQTKLRRESES